MIQVKVCGITQILQLEQLEELGVGYAGFIFYPSSPRYAGNAKVNSLVLQRRNFKIRLTGVFVNPTAEEVQTACRLLPGISVLQFHGSESPGFCKSFTKKFKVIKAFSVNNRFSTAKITADYRNACDYFLFDTHSKNYGGSGIKFNWDILLKENIAKPFFLSGGIDAADISGILSFRHPGFYGVDINSRFELEPGIKDMEKIKGFVKNIKSI
jgi:phosphoribosylanthranilate isomerase